MIRAIVLAAGRGSRLGLPKALADLGGRTAVEIVAATCLESLADEVVVVVGAERERVVDAVARVPRPPGGPLLSCVHAERWCEGRTASLQAGWAGAAADTHALVFPVDHAVVALVTLDAMLGVFGYAAAAPAVVVPVLASPAGRRRGHPIVLGARLREKVMSMGADQPLHELVHAEEVLEVPVDDPGILLDIDTADDLERARAALAARYDRPEDGTRPG